MHNRVESIYSVARLMQKLVPKARVVVGHGQMERARARKGDAEVRARRGGRAGFAPRSSKTAWIFRAPTPSSSIAPIASGFPSCISFAGAWGVRTSAPTPTCWCRPRATLTPLAQAAPVGAARIQRTGRGFSHRGAGSGAARRRQSAGARAARPHQRHRLRPVLPDAGARGGRQEGRSAALRKLRATLNLGLDIRIPPEYIPERESAAANLQANRGHRQRCRTRGRCGGSWRTASARRRRPWTICWTTRC